MGLLRCQPEAVSGLAAEAADVFRSDENGDTMHALIGLRQQLSQSEIRSI